MRTHYEVLGVKRNASAEDVRRAFRRLVLQHHPDRSRAPGAAERFREITGAYEVLRDPAARADYDRTLESHDPKPQAKAPTPPQPPKPYATAPDTARLANLFSKGRFEEAEQLAHSILSDNPRVALAYAVLGDIARARGEINHASNLYAHAMQMEPRNHAYQQRYYELLNRVSTAAQTQTEIRWGAMAGFTVPVFGAIYLAVSKEPAVVGTWTLGLIVMALLSGLAAGVSMGLAGLLDNCLGLCWPAGRRPGLATYFLSGGIGFFWVALTGYWLFGLARAAYVQSVTRVFVGSAAALFLLLMGCAASPSLTLWPTTLWAGNLIHLGVLLGWMVSDAFRGNS